MRLVSTVLLLFTVGCVQVDADIAGLSASAGDESFDAAGAAAGRAMVVDRTLVFDGGRLASTLKKARIDAVTLTPARGVASLDFLTSLTLVLHAPTGDVPLIDASGEMTAPDGSVTLPINLDVDPTLLAQPLNIDASIRLVAPADAWAMHITALLTVQGHAELHP